MDASYTPPVLTATLRSGEAKVQIRREVGGWTIRSLALALDRLRVRDKVYQHVSTQVVATLSHPPSVFAFHDATPVEETFDAVGKMAGRHAVRQLGFEAARAALGWIPASAVRSTFSGMRLSPSVVFNHWNWFVAPMVRGTQFSFASGGPSLGAMEIRHGEPVKDMVYAAWEGAFHWVFELCAVDGTVLPARSDEGGRSAMVAVSWETPSRLSSTSF